MNDVKITRVCFQLKDSTLPYDSVSRVSQKSIKVKRRLLPVCPLISYPAPVCKAATEGESNHVRQDGPRRTRHGTSAIYGGHARVQILSDQGQQLGVYSDSQIPPLPSTTMVRLSSACGGEADSGGEVTWVSLLHKVARLCLVPDSKP